VGNFPVLWTEWNGPYRDTVRDYWRGVAPVGDFATRFSGSADLYERDGRRPFASINFVTAHDGFTLADLVSYNEKHNEANLEDNHDGSDDNRSWNCGAEGPTDDPGVLALRARQQRNFLTTLFLSQGVPMLLAGDEMGRSQGGNNNAYCQDNAISWFDWTVADADLHAFTRRLIEFRHGHPVLRRDTFFAGEPDAQGLPDIWWFRPDGRRMARRDWQQAGGPVAVFLNGDAIRSVTPHGEAVHDDSLILLFNAGHEAVEFLLPPRRFGAHWAVELSTSDGITEGRDYAARQPVSVQDRSVIVLSRRR
jgi:glycogen operon protein